MTQFKKLLLALDLSPSAGLLISRVLQMYREELDHLHVVHVVREGMYDASLSDYASILDSDVQGLLDRAEVQLKSLLQSNGLHLPTENIFLLQGEPAFQIKRLAGMINADLLIVGSHCKEDDLLQLPGTTTNCVMQGMAADVMAVRI